MNPDLIDQLLIPAVAVIIGVIARALERGNGHDYLETTDLPTETIRYLESIDLPRDLITQMSCPGLVIILAQRIEELLTERNPRD